MVDMELPTLTKQQEALDRAIHAAGGKTALMRQLNERGWEIGSHNTIGQWRINGVPEKYCPDIEDLYGIRCEELSPGTNWTVLRRPIKSLRTPVTPNNRKGA